MSISWNVKDINVFSDLSDSLSKTSDMVDDIWEETDAAIRHAMDTCSDAIETLKTRIQSIEFEIETLQDDLDDLFDKNRYDPDTAREIQELIEEKKRELKHMNSALGMCVDLEKKLELTRRTYEKSFVYKRREYDESVSAACALLDSVKETLELGLS